MDSFDYSDVLESLRVKSGGRTVRRAVEELDNPRNCYYRPKSRRAWKRKPRTKK